MIGNIGMLRKHALEKYAITGVEDSIAWLIGAHG